MSIVINRNRRSINNLRRWLFPSYRFNEILAPTPLSYSNVLSFLKRSYIDDIRYDILVFAISIYSFVLWLLIMFVLVLHWHKEWNIFFNIEYYPSVLWSALTGVFKQYELQITKVKLVNLLKRRGPYRNIGNNKFEDLVWEEFKTKFQ